MSKINGDKARKNISDKKQAKMREKLRAMRNESSAVVATRGSKSQAEPESTD